MNMNVFKFLVNLIDTVAERGAFRGDELQNVGEVRSVLVDFIAQNEQQPVENTDETTTETEN